MPNYNQITIIGHVGNVDTTQKFRKFSVAHTSKYKDKNNEEVSTTQWFNAVIFNDKLNTVVDKYISKGMAVMLVGELKVSAYLAKDGSAKANADIVVKELKMLSSKSAEENAVATSTQSKIDNFADFDDEIPF